MTRKYFGMLAALLMLASTTTNLRAQTAREGIAVHGHWVFEVRNADGTLAQRREIENALEDTGKEALVSLFTGSSVGQWAIVLGGDRQMFLDTETGTLKGVAQIARRNFWCDPSAGCSGSTAPFLTLSTIEAQSPNSQLFDQFVLKGSATAHQTGKVVGVYTLFMSCASLASATCATVPAGLFPARAFSGKVLATPIELAPEQSLHVTVTISFS